MAIRLNGSKGYTPNPNGKKIPTMFTIPQAVERFHPYGLSEHYIRVLVKTNAIPTIRVGKKYLINEDILIDYLNGATFD